MIAAAATSSAFALTSCACNAAISSFNLCQLAIFCCKSNSYFCSSASYLILSPSFILCSCYLCALLALASFNYVQLSANIFSCWVFLLFISARFFYSPIILLKNSFTFSIVFLIATSVALMLFYKLLIVFVACWIFSATDLIIPKKTPIFDTIPVICSQRVLYSSSKNFRNLSQLLNSLSISYF